MNDRVRWLSRGRWSITLGYKLSHPGVGGLQRAAGRELRWHGVTLGQWGFGFLHSVKVQDGPVDLSRRGDEP